MRITKIEIVSWRGFENVSFEIPEDSGLICLVGGNGSGKTQILELISACAHQFGLSHGAANSRGNPLGEPGSDFKVEAHISKGIIPALDTSFGNQAEDAISQAFTAWDRTLTISSASDHRVRAGGIEDDGIAKQFASRVISMINQSEEVHYLMLDADRAYPAQSINKQQVVEAMGEEWGTIKFTKGRAHTGTKTLYDEWSRYFIGKYLRAAQDHYKKSLESEEQGSGPIKVDDVFADYRKSLSQVLPHLKFTGLNGNQTKLLFSTNKKDLVFEYLSGGERELAFLIGQIERFSLRRGIFLIDEPELHLNPDLVRSWVEFLSNTVETGQVWLATHSLEAVEAAGQSSTFLLERDSSSKKVSVAAPLEERPLLSALSRAVGTPAFSIAAMRFIYIEGEPAIGERDRYGKVCDLGSDTRFIESGNCKAVEHRVASISSLAQESGQAIRVGGVVDRDWKTQSEIQQLESEKGLIVLAVHEVENFFLHEQSLVRLASLVGKDDFDFQKTLVKACDERAGLWIYGAACASQNGDGFIKPDKEAKKAIAALSWNEISGSPEEIFRNVVHKSLLSEHLRQQLYLNLNKSAAEYKEIRVHQDLWKKCEGKQVLGRLASAIGLAGVHQLEKAVLRNWNENPGDIPNEVSSLRERLSKI